MSYVSVQVPQAPRRRRLGEVPPDDALRFSVAVAAGIVTAGILAAWILTGEAFGVELGTDVRTDAKL